MSVTLEKYRALEAEHGKGRILVVQADDLNIALRRIDAKEWGVFRKFQEAKDDAVAEAMLRRAVVGLGEDETRAEKARLAQVLEEDPQLGDFWGLQLLKTAGFQAQIDVEEMADPAAQGWRLTCPLLPDPIRAHRLTRQQWQEVRRAVAKQGPGASDLLAFRLATGLDPAAYDLLPALPYVLGHICAGLGTKAGAAPKSYPLD